MKWRVMVELTASDGTVRTHEISTGGSNTAECSAATVGLTSPRGAHLMLKVRCAVMNGTLEYDHAVAEAKARRPYRRAA
jgi:hypothetical protein